MKKRINGGVPYRCAKNGKEYRAVVNRSIRVAKGSLRYWPLKEFASYTGCFNCGGFCAPHVHEGEFRPTLFYLTDEAFASWEGPQ